MLVSDVIFSAGMLVLFWLHQNCGSFVHIFCNHLSGLFHAVCPRCLTLTGGVRVGQREFSSLRVLPFTKHTSTKSGGHCCSSWVINWGRSLQQSEVSGYFLNKCWFYTRMGCTLLWRVSCTKGPLTSLQLGLGWYLWTLKSAKCGLFGKNPFASLHQPVVSKLPSKTAWGKQHHTVENDSRFSWRSWKRWS